MIGVIFLWIAIPKIIEGLTLPEDLKNRYLGETFYEIASKPVTVEEIADFIHEDTRYEFSGAICNDGHVSHSQGRGTCSYHQGVDYYFKIGDYSKNNC